MIERVEVDAAIRAVQNWMASDLQSALGYEPNINPDPSFGDVGWADWWAKLCHEVRTLAVDRGRVVSRLSGYFVAPDANEELWLWRERGDYPVPILSRHELRNDPDVWDLIVAAADSEPTS